MKIIRGASGRTAEAGGGVVPLYEFPTPNDKKGFSGRS
jgi:hypothetical protein